MQLPACTIAGTPHIVIDLYLLVLLAPLIAQVCQLSFAESLASCAIDNLLRARTRMFQAAEIAQRARAAAQAAGKESRGAKEKRMEEHANIKATQGGRVAKEVSRANRSTVRELRRRATQVLTSNSSKGCMQSSVSGALSHADCKAYRRGLVDYLSFWCSCSGMQFLLQILFRF